MGASKSHDALPLLRTFSVVTDGVFHFTAHHSKTWAKTALANGLSAAHCVGLLHAHDGKLHPIRTAQEYDALRQHAFVFFQRNSVATLPLLLGNHTFSRSHADSSDGVMTTIDELMMGRTGSDPHMREQMTSEEQLLYWYEAWPIGFGDIAQIHPLPSNKLAEIPLNATSVIVSGSDPITVEVHFYQTRARLDSGRVLLTLQCTDGDLTKDIIARVETRMGYSSGDLELHSSNTNPCRVFKPYGGIVSRVCVCPSTD